MNFRPARLPAVAAAALLLSTIAAGQCWTEQDRVDGTGLGWGAYLGGTVAVDGDLAVAGAYGACAARMYHYEGGQWVEEATFMACLGYSDGYGAEVDVAGDFAVVSSPEFNGSGKVFLYERLSSGTWVQRAGLGPGGPPLMFSQYGASVSLCESLLGVIKSYDQNSGLWIYRRQSNGAWTLDELIPSNVASYVSVSEDTVIARLDQLRAYRRASDGTWLEESFPAIDGYPLLDGDRFVIQNTPAGTVDVYLRTGTAWNLEDSIATTDRLLDFEGDRILLWSLQSGAHSLCERAGSSWLLRQTLDPEFGSRGSISGDRVMFGSPGADTTTSDDNHGVALFFERSDAPLYCTGKTSSLGCVPFVTTTGTPSTTASFPFRITARDALPNEAGFLVYSFKKANLNFHGAKLCVKAPWTRVQPVKGAKATGAPPCSGVLSRDFNTRIQGAADPLLSTGQTVFAQWFQRDPTDPAGFGDALTDAVRFEICP